MKTLDKITIVLVTIFSLCISSCDDYLDVEPKGLTILETIQDYDLLLNGTWRSMYYTSDTDMLELSSDNFVSTAGDLGDLDDPLNVHAKAYRFDSDLFLNNDNGSLLWSKPYENIYTYNTVINNVGTAQVISGYTEDDKKSIIAEARVGRTFEYWMLVNAFGKQYNEATSATDLGVPLILFDDVSGSVPARATVKEIYDFLINEVTEALPDLPDTPKNYTRESKGSAYAFLARYYLSMSNYEKALEFANKALAEKNEISDFTAVSVPGYYALENEHRAEQYTYMTSDGSINWVYSYGAVSDEMFNLLSDDDTRKTLFISDCNWVYDPATGWEYLCGLPPAIAYGTLGGSSVAPTVPEMYLIRAECNARLSAGTISEVVDDLNMLRRKRINNYTDLTEVDFANKTEALVFVLEERRRETYYLGLRFFDLKRLNLEPEFAKSIVHVLDGTTYTLAPNTNNWVFPIPADIMSFNSHLEQNPRD